MKPNVFFFTWTEKFLLKIELDKRKSAFEKKYWLDNIFSFNSENITPSWLINSIFSWWLFSNKRLVIIKWLPKDSDTSNKISDYDFLQDEITSKFEIIPDECVLVFVSYKPDKRWKFYKFLEKNSNLKIFSDIKLPTIRKTLKSFFPEYINISDLSIDYMIHKIWRDLFNLKNESDKLISYCSYNRIQNIDNNLIDFICFSQTTTNSFDVLDNIFNSKEKTMALIQENIDAGVEEFQFLWMLYWWIKAALNIKDVYSQWITSSSEIAKKLWLHPFVVAKTLKGIENIISKEIIIKRLFFDLISLEYSIKSWNYPLNWFWLEIKKIIYKM